MLFQNAKWTFLLFRMLGLCLRDDMWEQNQEELWKPVPCSSLFDKKQPSKDSFFRKHS